MTGVQGFEPQLTDSESAVLPLDDTPSLTPRYRFTASEAKRNIPYRLAKCKF